jgi:hypothetical protein
MNSQQCCAEFTEFSRIKNTQEKDMKKKFRRKNSGIACDYRYALMVCVNGTMVALIAIPAWR